MAQRNKFLVAAGIVLFLMTVVLSAIATAIVHKVIVKPINVLSETAEKEQADESTTVEYGFENVRIRTGDEIETLAVSMAKMEKVINEHIENLIRTRNELDESRRQIEAATEMANVDSMTGVRNKRAYDSATAELDGEIAEGTARFGIAMFDLNGLKTINDEYGHDKGDAAIRTLCDLVCGRLKRSPVFRIGGDEFVAILKGDDFEMADELLGSIERTIDARNANDRLEPWEKGSAAVGYAEFDRNVDSSVEDVFKRADATMYETKAAMKGENPKR
jgi:diguanylate cyclase (GGDEF)-like protein